ncbi:MAG TPA: hypothetical protein VFK94_06560 [Patescibacteria group bacterium]|nr:hypothetical protein [Patescibacteria group bacterium]
MEQAYKLLITMLSARQLNSLLKRGYFDVTLANGHRYRLNPEIASIWLMKKDKRWEHAIQFCLHPNARITPPPDISIQHLMLLATDEKLFLETANHTCSTWYENWLYKRGYTYDEHTKRKVRRSLAR